MKTTKKVKTVDLDALIEKAAKEPEYDVIVPNYVSRTFLEPMRYGDGKPSLGVSTGYVYAIVGEVKNTKHSYADGYIEFGGDSSRSCTLFFSAYEPEDIEIALDKVDNLEREVMDFCAKMREALEAYKVVAKVHKEGK